jgi:(p)ppGpp synthase/HD superfamily hydrolase
VLVGTPEDCYRALGVAHQTWRAVPGRFKDYISTPKQNDYQSLHTTVIGPHHMRVEMQIRTQKMHEIAEYGVAAHALYKDARSAGEAIDGVKAPAAESNAYRWLRRLVDLLAEGDSPKEFLEHTKLELFQDQVYCFTPKGQLIALPKGATPIDFAYAVHTSIGDSCVGCKINGQHAPLSTELENGDEVDIVRSEAQVPPAAWEGIAVTGKARQAIRRATRAAMRKQYAELGKEILTRMLVAAGREYSAKDVTTALPRLGHKNLADALAAMGRGELAVHDVLRAMGVEVDEKAKAARGKRVQAKPASPEGLAVPVRGASRDAVLKISTDVGAVPGERIVGIQMPGEGVTIYPIFARALQQFEDEPQRWIDLAWDADAQAGRCPARIRITLFNEPGALAQVAQTIGDADGNIDELQMTARPGARDFFDLDILVEVHDLKHLNDIMDGLRARPLVSQVARFTG